MAQLRPGRPEAAAVIWDWRAGSAPAASPAGRSLAGRARVRGSLQALVGLGVGSLIYAFGPPTIGLVVLGIASFIGLSALASPLALFAGIERAFAALGNWVGRGLTWLLLPGIFYLFFVPFHALFRRGRRDAMKRFYEPDAASYWSARERGRAGSTHHERQY
jgi:hypothetical protein